jgi:lipoprotein-releasing system permease protein
MRYEVFIGLRYLMAKRRASVVSIITMISVSGVALGVTALIVVLSVMGGFKKDLMQKILGTKAHIVVRGLEEAPLAEPLKLTELAMTVPGITGASPYIESEGMISSASGLSGVVMRGILPDRIGQVSELPREIREGRLEYLVDDAKLVEEVKGKRDRELDELLERLQQERSEANALRRDMGVGVGADMSIKLDLSGAPDPAALIKPDAPKPEFKPLGEGREERVEVVDLKPVAPVEGGLPTLEELGAPSGPGPQLAEADAIPELPGEEDGAMPGLFDEEPEAGGMPPIDDERPAARKVAGLIIGPELAKSLQVGLGDEVNVVTPNGEIGPMGRMPRSRPFRIVAIFYSGMYEYDANYAYMSLDVARDFLGVEGATGVELKTEDVERSLEMAKLVEGALGPSVAVLDWQELNRSLFYALKLEKIAMFVVLTFIILVASFSIVAMLIMIVIEKGREIALLKAIGATDAAIMRTFIFQGTVIGAVGAVIGLGMGLLICWLLATVGFPLNSDVYYISTLPVAVEAGEVVAVVFSAIGISMLATIYPSWQAARLRPVDGLRDE